MLFTVYSPLELCFLLILKRNSKGKLFATNADVDFGTIAKPVYTILCGFSRSAENRLKQWALDLVAWNISKPLILASYDSVVQHFAESIFFQCELSFKKYYTLRRIYVYVYTYFLSFYKNSSPRLYLQFYDFSGLWKFIFMFKMPLLCHWIKIALILLESNIIQNGIFFQLIKIFNVIFITFDIFSFVLIWIYFFFLNFLCLIIL